MSRPASSREQNPCGERHAVESVRWVVGWYFETVYGSYEGPGVLPFYCDPQKVGRFAVSPDQLAAGTPAAMFQLLVTLAMYQARRDVMVMALQAAMGDRSARLIADVAVLRHAIRRSPCPHLADAKAFDELCDVSKDRSGNVTCSQPNQGRCHVRVTTQAMRRTGDMGKLPTSAWLNLWANDLFEAQSGLNTSPQDRARRLVQSIAKVHRIGEKLATLFVSAISVPALAPGLTPGHPNLDGHVLVVVDTHVARIADALRASHAPRTYEARARWVTRIAERIDLRFWRPELPSFSPRLVQQALYHFGSRSNRASRDDRCALQSCGNCPRALCPLAA